MLTAGLNHVALLTEDLDRLLSFYVDVFDVEVPDACNVDEPGPATP